MGTVVLRECRVGRWKKQRGRMGFLTEERGGSGEVREVRNRLTRTASWPPESREMPGPGGCTGACGGATLVSEGCVFTGAISIWVACMATGSHGDSLGCC